jgi:hypothetical protein
VLSSLGVVILASDIVSFDNLPGREPATDPAGEGERGFDVIYCQGPDKGSQSVMNRSTRVRSKVGSWYGTMTRRYDKVGTRRNVLSVFGYEVDYKGQTRPL